jgi:DNA-binding FadR family transcriptional regulator
MRSTKPTKAQFEDILVEHRELRGMAEDLRAFCELPRPDVEAEEAITWASELSQRLVRFHDRIYRHFHEEESSGFLEEFRQAYPNFSRSVEALENDHETVLRELRAVLDAAMLYAENKAPDRPNLRQQTLAILERFEQHEHEETDLIQRLISEDIGVGD